MKLRPILSLAVISILFIGCNNSTKNKQKPNVLFIIADDFGYHDMSIMGSKYYETPNIDKIAESGMIFSDGYAACQVCSPSRASIMSGKFPATHGVTDWIGEASGVAWRKQNRHDILLPSEYKHSLDLDYTTLPEAMQQEGYKTFFAGKWHIGDEGSWPEDHGFDINIGGWSSGSPKGGYFSPFINPKLPNLKPGENLSFRLADETSKFIKEHKDSTFFAFLSFYAVHGPIQTTEEKWEKYREKAEKMGVADHGYEMEAVLPIRTEQDNPIYAGLVETMDQAIGRVIKTLKEEGLDDNTIVIFTSDNGGVSSGDNFSTSNLPLRGGKGYQWEGGIREPYFIYVPWLQNSNEICTVPVSGVDFYPTILDLVGADLRPEDHTDGISLLPLLEGKTVEDRPLLWHYPHYGNQGGSPSSIIRLGDWKLIHYWEDGHDELYNLRDDISEQNDLAETEENRTKELRSTLDKMLKERDAQIPIKDPEYDSIKREERLEKLRTVKLKQLEKERVKMLAPGWKPNKDWWNSKVTND